MQRQIGNPERIARSRRAANQRKDHRRALRRGQRLLVRQLNAPQIRLQRSRPGPRIADPHLDSAHRPVIAIAVVEIGRHALRANGVRHSVELVEVLRRCSDHQTRPGSLQSGDDLRLQGARRHDRHLIEARRIRTVGEKVKSRLVGKVEDRIIRSRELPDRLRHLIDAECHLLCVRIALHVKDPPLVVDQIIDASVDQVGNPEQHAENRNGQKDNHRCECASPRIALHPDLPQSSDGHDGENHQHRSDEKCREILMAKLRAAERGPLRDRGKHCENQECTIERVHAPPQSALDQVDRGDSDGERAEDQMELLEENELGQRMQIQILPECGDEVRKRQRPNRIDDARDGDERDRGEVRQNAAGDQIDDKRGASHDQAHGEG